MKMSIFKKLSFLMTVAVMTALMLPVAPVAAAVPTAPTGLLAITINGGQVNLEWNDVATETGYAIERAPDIGGLGPGTYAQIGTTGANVITYSDMNVVAQTGYWYRVKATNVDGQSFPSNEVGIRTPNSTPSVSLVTPAPSPAVIKSGISNTIQASASDAGSTVSAVDYQIIANNAAGVFNAKDIYATQKNLTILAARAASPVANTQAMPAGLPAGAIAEFEIRGTVASVNTGTGTWQIGSPALTVYESITGNAASTVFVGARHPHANDGVKIVAYRTTTNGPLIAKTITLISTSQTVAAPAVILSFLYNGSVSAMTPPATDVGYLISGEVWTVGSGMFRVDEPSFMAYIDPSIGIGTPVTVRFAPMPAEANIARNIFNQITPAILNPVNTNPIYDTTPVPANLPAGAWLYVIVDGVVSAHDPVLNTWTIGSEGVMVYETPATLVAPITVGDEMLAYCRRTLTPGPLVAEQIHQILPGPLAMPYKGTAVETHLMFNGVIQTMGLNTWTVGGQTFIVDDSEGKARIDSMPFPSFAVGNPITVEFEHVGETIPDPANWAPMTFDSGSGMWTASATPPGIPGTSLTGTTFLRVTDAKQQGAQTKVSTTIQYLPAAAPIAPSGLTGSVVSGSQVNLSWTDNSLDEDYFRIERAPDNAGNPGTWAILTIVGPNTTSFSDTLVSPNTTYHYRVIAANGAGFSAPSNVFMVTTIPPATKVVFMTPSRAINAGVDSQIITIQAQDPVGNVANVLANNSVALTTTSAGIFKDAPGGATITTVTILAGASTASFYYNDAVIGTPMITATPTGLTAASQTESVIAAGAASQLGFTTIAQSFAALTASGVITVQLQNGVGAAVVAASPVTVNLMSSSAMGKFDISAGGAFDGTITSVVIPAAASSVDFYYKDGMAGAPMITASNAGLNAAMQTETIAAAAAAKLAFTMQPAGAAAGTAFTTQPAVTVQDAAGNTVTSYVGNVTVAITAGSGNPGAALGGTTTVAVASGVATFTDLSIDLIGNNYSLDATSGALTMATSSTFNVVAALQNATISLLSGWNLISMPLIPASTSRATILSTISSNVISIWAYDSTTGVWSSWNPITGGTLTTIRDGKGYWLNMNAPATLNVSGVALPAPPALPPTYSTVPGWNLIGFKNTATKTVGAYLTGCTFRYTVWGFKNGAYVPINASTDNLEPGLGYWTYFDAASIITP